MSDPNRPNSPRGEQGPPSSSPARSRPASPSPAGQAPLGYDPAKPNKTMVNTRMELPAEAYLTENTKDIFPVRGQKLNTEGQVIQLEVNQYRMTKFNFSKKIYQYDVSVGHI